MGHLLRNVQGMLDGLTEWGRSRGPEFNPSKTEVVMFSRRNIPPPFKLEVDGQEIEFSDSVKYLGVYLDRKLFWHEHILNKISKAKKTLNLLKKQSNNVYGPSPKLAAWIFTGIVRPALSYAAFCWAHGVNTAKIKNALFRLDRSGLLGIAGTAPSTPTRGL